MAIIDEMWSEEEKSTFIYEGTVTTGNKIGRTIGIPTINLLLDNNTVDIAFGVYASRVIISGNIYYGIANIGIKPTIQNAEGVNPVGIEVNIFDFDGDLYNESVRVLFYKFIRPECKFSGVEELKLQIKQDIEHTRSYFGL